MATNKQIIEFQAKGIARLKKQYKELEKRTRGLEKSTRKGSSALGGMVAKLGITTAALYLATKAITGIVKAGAGFEKTMSNLRAISGATGEQMKALEKNARDLGATTVFTATQVGELSVEFAKLGFTSKEITAVTKDTLALAAASGTDLATAASVAGQTLRAFGMNAKEMSKVTDTMAAAFSGSALDLEKFTNSMQYVAPVAKAVGFSVQGTTALLGGLANAGISGSMAGTALRTVFLKLADSNSDLSKKLGGSVTSADELLPALKKLSDSGVDLTEILGLVDKRAVSAFKVLLDGSDDVAKLKVALDDSAGAAQRMADIQLDNLQGKATLLGSAMEGLGITLFDQLAPSLNSAVIGMTGLVKSMNDYFAIPTSKKMEDETRRVNTLTKAIEFSEIGSITRNKLINELNTIYPDLLKGLSDEEIAQGKLTKRLESYNTQQSLRIALVQADEETLKLAEDKAKVDVKVAESTMAITDAMMRMSKAMGTVIDPQLSMAQNYQVLMDQSDLMVKQWEDEADTVSYTSDRAQELEDSESSLLGARNDLMESYKFGNSYIESYLELIIEQEKLAGKLSTAEEIQARKKEIIIKMYSQEGEAIDGLAGSVDDAAGSANAYGLVIRRLVNDIGDFTIAEVEATEIISQTLQERIVVLAAHHEENINKASELANGIMNVSDNLTAYKMQNLDNERQKEIDAAMASGLNEEEKQAKIQNIRENYAKKERKLRQAQKGPMIAQAIASTAVGVAKALELGPIGIALGVLVAAAGALEIATISAQQFAKGGQIKGGSHAQGGVNINAEGGEFIMRKKAVEKLGLSFMESINQFEDGGMVEDKFDNLVKLVSRAPKFEGGFNSVSHLVKKGRADGKFADGGLINNITPQLIPQEPTQAPQTNYHISISAPLLDETVIDAILPAIQKAQRMNLA